IEYLEEVWKTIELGGIEKSSKGTQDCLSRELFDIENKLDEIERKKKKARGPNC
ncbi:22990_t:CDS:1, partial [Entrophospora sp. SA101]